jgi:hypothetical protein
MAPDNTPWIALRKCVTICRGVSKSSEQKRPILGAKETYYTSKRDLQRKHGDEEGFHLLIRSEDPLRRTHSSERTHSRGIPPSHQK